MSPSSVHNDGIEGVDTNALVHLGPNVGKPVQRWGWWKFYLLNLLTILSRLRYYNHIQRCVDFFYEPFGHHRTNVFRTSRKVFSSAWGDRRTKYPSQEDILEWAKPALPLEETFNDLFLEDFVWAHVVSLHQRLDTLQYHFMAPLVGLLQRGLQDKE